MEYLLFRRLNSRRITLSVNTKGVVRVTAPQRISTSVIEQFVHTKKDWINRVLENMKSSGHALSFASPEYRYHTHKARAKKVIGAQVRELAEIHGFVYQRVSIKNMSSRWGSCSTSGNLNFTYVLLFVPEELREYVIVHELCHLRHHNHSAKFWAEVESIVPDYRARERELKKY